MHPIAAVIYLPSAISLTSALAQSFRDHLQRRGGYELLTFVQEWPVALQLLRSGRVQAVIYAEREYWSWVWRGAPAADEATQDLSAHRWRIEQARRERRGIINWSPGRVRGVARSAGPAGVNGRRSCYETARLLPLGDDGGFAESFLNERSRRS